MSIRVIFSWLLIKKEMIIALPKNIRNNFIFLNNSFIRFHMDLILSQFHSVYFFSKDLHSFKLLFSYYTRYPSVILSSCPFIDSNSSDFLSRFPAFLSSGPTHVTSSPVLKSFSSYLESPEFRISEQKPF